MPAEGRHALPTRMKGLPLLLLLKFLVPSAQVAHDASEVQYLLNMAGLAASQKQYGKAAMNYKRAASLMGKVVNMQLQLRMGDMFMFTGDFEDARRAYQVPFMIDRSQSRMSVEEWIDVGGRMALAAELTNQTRAAISILEKIVIAHFTSTNTTNYPLLIFFHLFDLLNSHSDCKMGAEEIRNSERLLSTLRKLASEHLLTTGAMKGFDRLGSLEETAIEEKEHEELLSCDDIEPPSYGHVSTIRELIAKYSIFHRWSLACCRSSTPRFLVYRPSDVGEGWGNRVLSLSSSFMFAMRTKRVFLVNWTEPMDLKELIRGPSGFDWEFSEAMKSCGEKTDLSQPEKFEIEDAYQRRGEILSDDEPGNSLIYSSLHDLYRPIRFLDEFAELRCLCEGEISRKRGCNRSLSKWELFQCTASLLFRPSKAILESLRSELHARANVLGGGGPIISAAVRLGSKTTSYYPVLNKAGEMNFLRCVRLLLEVYGRTASLSVFSDSPALRQTWKERFQDRAWLSNSTVEYSGGKEKFKSSTNTFNRGVMDAVVEWFLIGEADDAILSSGSTFGQTAWARTMRKTPIEVDNFDRTCFRRFQQEAETVWDRACCSRHHGKCPSTCLLHP